MSDKIKLVFSILLCQGEGLLGSLFTAPVIDSWSVVFFGLRAPGLALDDIDESGIIFIYE